MGYAVKDTFTLTFGHSHSVLVAQDKWGNEGKAFKDYENLQQKKNHSLLSKTVPGYL